MSSKNPVEKKREIIIVVELNKQQIDAKEIALENSIISIGILSYIKLQTKVDLLGGMSLLHMILAQAGSL